MKKFSELKNREWGKILKFDPINTKITQALHDAGIMLDSVISIFHWCDKNSAIVVIQECNQKVVLNKNVMEAILVSK